MDVHTVAQRALKRFLLKHFDELCDPKDADWKLRRLFVKDIFGSWPEQLKTAKQLEKPEKGEENEG